MRRLHGKNIEKYGRPEIVSFPQIMTAVYGFGASSSEVNQCSQHLTILTISWSMVGELPPSPPGDYYLQTQISVPGYKRVYLPLFKAAYKPFHIQKAADTPSHIQGGALCC